MLSDINAVLCYVLSQYQPDIYIGFSQALDLQSILILASLCKENEVADCCVV
jgi:hypothetical protein